MIKLVMITLILTTLATTAILSIHPEPLRTVDIAPIAVAMETVLAGAQFSPVELERMDRLSQRFPQAANAFQKLYALGKVEDKMPAQTYRMALSKYTSQLDENRAQTKKLLQHVMSTRSQDEAMKAWRNLAVATAMHLKMDLNSQMASVESRGNSQN